MYEGLYPNTNRTKNLYVKSLLIQQTGTYNQLFMRPYVTNADGYVINAISKRLEESGNQSLNPEVITGLASNIVSPMSQPQGLINVPNGWDVPRARFVLVVVAESTVGIETTYYIQGYTDYYGVSHSQAIDPNMCFYINSITSTSKTNILTPLGTQCRENVFNSSQLLWDPITNAASYDLDRKLTMRPMDVYTGMQNLYIRQGMDYLGMNNDLDNRSVTLAEPINSNRKNNIPVHYLSNIVNAYNTGRQIEDHTNGEPQLLGRVKDLLREDSVGENPFIMRISRSIGTGMTNIFTYHTLEQIDPGTRANTVVLTMGPTQMAQIHHTGLTENWNGVDRATVVATTLSQALPSIMMDLLISKISFRSTNHDIGMQMNTIIEHVKTINNADMSQNYELFKYRLERELLYDLTFGNQEPYMLQMRVDIYGETWISLSLGSDPLIDYVTPSFCDNLLSPVVTRDQHHFDTVSADFEQLVRSCSETVTTPFANTFVNYY